jgi:hypothetical protein
LRLCDGCSQTGCTPFNNGAPSPTLAGTEDILLVHVTNTSTTVAPPTDTANVAGAVTVTINNLNGGGSGTFVVAGRIVVTRSDTLGAASTFTLTSILPSTLILGAFDYTLSNPVYIPPTIQAGQPGSGGISITVSETPEPASMALMGLGVALVAGLGLRRKLVR